MRGFGIVLLVNMEDPFIYLAVHPFLLLEMGAVEGPNVFCNCKFIFQTLKNAKGPEFSVHILEQQYLLSTLMCY